MIEKINLGDFVKINFDPRTMTPRPQKTVPPFMNERGRIVKVWRDYCLVMAYERDGIYRIPKTALAVTMTQDEYIRKLQFDQELRETAEMIEKEASTWFFVNMIGRCDQK